MRIPFMPMTFALLFSIFVVPALSADGKGSIKTPALVVVEDFKSDDYYKFNVGSTWTYKKIVTHGDTTNGSILYQTFDSTVTSVGPKGEVVFGTYALYMDGDFMVVGMTEDGKEFVANLRLMKNGMKAGDTWDGPVVEQSEEMKATFVGFEDIETPAGKFKVVHIKYATKVMTLDFYHAPKVGLVKYAAKGEGFTNEQVLQKYTIK